MGVNLFQYKTLMELWSFGALELWSFRAQTQESFPYVFHSSLINVKIWLQIWPFHFFFVPL